MEKFSWLDAYFEGKIDEKEVGRKADKMNLLPLDMLAIASAVFEHRGKRERYRRKRKVSFADAHEDYDDNNDDYDYEAASMSRRFVKRRKRCSAHKKQKTHVDDSKQGRLEIGSSSAFNSSSDSGKRKKRTTTNDIASSSSSSSSSLSLSTPERLERLEREKPHKKSKKLKNIYRGPKIPPDLPDEFRNKITEKGGTDIQLLIQKPLYKTDVSHYHGRISMPVSQILSENFLNDVEKANLEHKNDMEVQLIDTKLNEIEEMNFKRWDMMKQNRTNNPMYVLNKKWNDLVDSNKLKCGNIVQLWSFRVNLKLHFALVYVENGDADDDEEDNISHSTEEEETHEQE